MDKDFGHSDTAKVCHQVEVLISPDDFVHANLVAKIHFEVGVNVIIDV
jgi:hypothetical protein